jgi:hypothetical protein
LFSKNPKLERLDLVVESVLEIKGGGKGDEFEVYTGVF